MPADPVATASTQAHTRSMAVLFYRGLRNASLWGLCFALAALPVSADEIRLKDGKKLYGVIVAYEENMFKVKTDFGYVLVEKDKIASIVPSAPAGGETPPPATAKTGSDSPKSGASAQPKPESAVASATGATPATTPGAKTVLPGTANQDKADKAVDKITGTAVKPQPPPSVPAGNPVAPAPK